MCYALPRRDPVNHLPEQELSLAVVVRVSILLFGAPLTLPRALGRDQHLLSSVTIMVIMMRLCFCLNREHQDRISVLHLDSLHRKRSCGERKPAFVFALEIRPATGRSLEITAEEGGGTRSAFGGKKGRRKERES